jgi:hypothetical protein
MDVKVTVSTEKALRKLKEYERVTGKTIAQSVRNHARLLGLELMRQAQPFYEKGAQKKAKEDSMRAISGDINSVVIALNQFWMAKFNNARAKSIKWRLYNKNREPWLTDEYRLISTLDELKAYYNAQKNPNRGRPAKRGDKTIGRHKAHGYPVVKFSLMKKLRVELQKRIGWSKAGWARAAQECKADTKAAFKMTGIPAWIKRHVSSARGTAEDFTNRKGNPHVRLRSGVPWMSKILSQNQRDAAKNAMRQNWIKSMDYEIKAELKKVKV